MRLLFLAAIAVSCVAQQGYLDRASCTSVYGWAYDGATNARVSVDILDAGTKIATVTADQFRQDLMDAGVGDGKHGFLATLTLPPGQHVLTARIGSITLADDTASQGSASMFTCAANTPAVPGVQVVPFSLGSGLMWGPSANGVQTMAVDPTQVPGVSLGPIVGTACDGVRFADRGDGSLLVCLAGKWGKITGVVFQ